MKVLLDTHLLIDDILDHPGHEAFVSSLSWAELQSGIAVSTDPALRASRQARPARTSETALGRRASGTDGRSVFQRARWASTRSRRTGNRPVKK